MRGIARSALRGAFAALVAAGASASESLAEIDRIGRAIAAEKCERPVEVKSSFVRNPTVADVADEMQSTTCRGWRVAVYRSLATTPARELPMSVVVEAAHPRVAPAWSVGSTPAQVQAVLGTPSVRRGESFGYSIDSARPGRDTLDFEVREGLVRAVTWTWEVD